jgi:hypothetical protein
VALYEKQVTISIGMKNSGIPKDANQSQSGFSEEHTVHIQYLIFSKKFSRRIII